MQLDALHEAAALPVVKRLNEVAKFEVATVTGANEYFCIDRRTARNYGLDQWTVPLLPKIRHARGLRYRKEDHQETLDSGAKGMLLHFSMELPAPFDFKLSRLYLELGRHEGLPDRYKCRIREPWYRIPFVRPERLMLSKRSHRFPRVVLNEAGVFTTDTIYRGRLMAPHQEREADFTAGFHNSLTLLTAELEGRSFGGGVLELVPSEISRLSVPFIHGFGAQLKHLDGLSRSSGNLDGSENLIDETDGLILCADTGVSPRLMDDLRDARSVLLRRRLDRN